jgi:hypothetical protein
MTIEDTWESRELPVLRAIARATANRHCSHGDVLDELEGSGLSEDQVMLSIEWLLDSTPPFITAQADMESEEDVIGFYWIRLTERGRRTVGVWPREDSYAAFLQLLEQRIQAEPDQEKRSRLTKFLEGAYGVGREVGTDLLTAWLKATTGLPG